MQTTVVQETLDSIFAGKTLEQLRYEKKCACCDFAGDSRDEMEPHHITYVPSLVKYLCHRCHAVVTYLNYERARLLGRKLNNNDRLDVWHDFLSGQHSKHDINVVIAWFDSLDFDLHKNYE